MIEELLQRAGTDSKFQTKNYSLALPESQPATELNFDNNFSQMVDIQSLRQI